MNKIPRLSGYGAILSILLPLRVVAGDADVHDRAEISAMVDAVVPNDILQATLAYEVEGNDSALLAGEVNRAITAAVQHIKQQPDIKLETSSYQTAPVYQKERRTAWKVRQSLKLEGRDAGVFSELLGQLQATLHLESESHATSPEKVREVEEALIVKAIQAFRARAEIVAHGFGYKSYRVVSVTINTPEYGQPAFSGARAMMARDAAIVIEAGEQKIQVGINGSIEMD
jgi:predicted secreted protein